MSAETARRNAVRWGALAIGVALFLAALYYINFRIAVGTIKQLGVALPLALFFSALWHLARTIAWAWCFPEPRRVGFLRLTRVRLAAEAFSYLTLRGIAGEPLKVVLLTDRVDPREATAAVALERLAYLVGTTIIVGLGSIVALVALPLTRVWFRVFRAFAIAATVVSLLMAFVIAGRGTYVQATLRAIDRRFGTSLALGTIARFVSAVERQMLELLRGNPVRLVVLLLCTISAYVCMALEAWVILRATGAPITPTGALAVETFSRVASFASAFIPANLGALEASSLAAVAAVGAVGGGAALALARRLRGLFWAGLGLAIYPRRQRPVPASTTALTGNTPSQKPVLLYFPFDEGVDVGPAARLAGLPIAERVLRSAFRASYGRVLVWMPEPAQPGSRALRRIVRSVGGSIVVIGDAARWARAIQEIGEDDAVASIGAGTVVSPALLADAAALSIGQDPLRDVPAGTGFPVSGVLRLTREEAMDPSRVVEALRLRRASTTALPTGVDVSFGRGRLAIRMTTDADLPAAEHTIRRSSYKDTDAKVARFNRRMSLPISIFLMPTPITANMISVTLVAIGFYSAWLFSTGHYLAGVIGGFLSLAASVLDGCDGEIARLKYQESALGCWIETFGDYSYYIAIFIGLTFGAVKQTGWEGFYWIGGVALGGTLVAFALLIYLRNRITAGQPEKLHAIAKERFKAEPTFWSRIVWRISFVATRAAMPYGIFAFSLFYALPGIVILAAIGSNVYWISLIVKLRHLLGNDAEQSVAA